MSDAPATVPQLHQDQILPADVNRSATTAQTADTAAQAQAEHQAQRDAAANAAAQAQREAGERATAQAAADAEAARKAQAQREAGERAAAAAAQAAAGGARPRQQPFDASMEDSSQLSVSTVAEDEDTCPAEEESAACRVEELRTRLLRHWTQPRPLR